MVETQQETATHSNALPTLRPLIDDDYAALLAFGMALPEADVLYLEDDLHSADIIRRLINAATAENWRQIVAVSNDGTIQAYASVRLLPGWSSHVADIILLVGEPWRRQGLGKTMAQAIFDAARELAVEKVIVEMLEEQHSGKAIFERLGFSVEGILKDHVRDRQGGSHNLMIMSYHVR